MGAHRLAALGVAVLLVAGCSSSAKEAAPGTSATPASTARSTAAPMPSGTVPADKGTSTAGTVTKTMQSTVAPPGTVAAHTDAGAEAFARSYVARVNQAWTEPDASLLSGFAVSSCKTCQNFVSAARGLEQSKSQYDGAPFTVGESLLLPESTPEQNQTQYLLTQEARAIVDAEGNVTQRLPRQAVLMQVTTEWRSNSWRIIELRIVTPS